MKRRYFRYVLLTASVVFSVPIAIAQSTNTPVNAPVNVLDGEPRDVAGEQHRASCNNDPLTGEIPVECRRWSEIA